MQDDRLARMALSALSEPDDKTLARAVAEHGAAATFERVCAGAGSLVRFAGRLAALDVERLAHMAQALGARILIPGDDEWPVGLDDLGLHFPLDIAAALPVAWAGTMAAGVLRKPLTPTSMRLLTLHDRWGLLLRSRIRARRKT